MSKATRTKEEAMESIKVVVRCRPIAQSELDKKFYQIVQMDHDTSSVSVIRPKSDGGTDTEEPRSFTFDYAYPPVISQKQVFNETARPIIDSVIDGYNGTIFAYGQTGTGKTFTMEGSLTDPNLHGIMPNTFTHIFEAVSGAAENTQFLVKASFIEIYLDDIYDLLSQQGTRTKMELKRDPELGVYIKDVNTQVAKNPEDLFRILSEGQKQRRVGATDMNKGSSRSHSIFSVVVETSTENADGTQSYRQGKLNLVDLAGSERQKKTQAEGVRMDEAKSINMSLSALGNVIKALASNASHIPFRDSKLTRLLEDSLGGNTKTVMIANVGPADYNFSETLSTLRYADRAKKIKNKPKINEDPRDTSLRAMQEEIALLKARLIAKQRGLDVGSMDKDALLRLAAGGVGGGVVEVVKVKVVDTGIRMDDLERKVAAARAEEQAMADKTDEEKRVIMQKKSEAEAEYARGQADLAANQALMAAEQEEMLQIQRSLAEKQQEVVSGGGQVEEAKKNRDALRLVEEELQKKRDEHEKIEAEAASKAEALLLMDEHYNGAEQEVQAVQKKLRALYSRYQVKKEDLRQVVDEFDAERSDLLETIHNMHRQIKLRSLMIESFLPYSFYQVVDAARRWDQYNEEWVIPGLELSGNVVAAEMQQREMASKSAQAVQRLAKNSEKVLGEGACADVGVGDIIDLPEYVDYINCNNNDREDVYMEYQGK